MKIKLNKRLYIYFKNPSKINLKNQVSFIFTKTMEKYNIFGIYKHFSHIHDHTNILVNQEDMHL